MFRLLSYFSLSSAIAMAILTATLVGAYQRHATAELVAITEKHNVAMARAISNSIWPKFSGYLTTVKTSSGDQLRSRNETAKLHSTLKEITNGLPVLKVKFYSLKGTTIYSSEFSQMGEDKSGSDGFVKAAMHRLPVSKISSREQFSAFSGTRYGVDLVESYVPMLDTDGRTLGVFELYYDVSSSVAQISDNRWTIAKLLVAALILLYLVLTFVVRRAELILKRQYGELQDALVARERLSMLGRLTATVSHELRNPLAALRNALFIIRELSNGSAELQPHIEAGERSISRCDNIVQDLLEYNRQQELDCESLDLSTWVREVVSEQVVPDGVTLKCNLPDTGPVVFIDDDRFRRVLINLVENSFQAHKNSDSPGLVKVSVSVVDDQAQISVEDDGEGIAPDVLPNIFEPLYTTKSFGSGLGLPTAKRLVEQHGGQLDVTSNTGSGAKFTITLPCEQQHQQKAA